MPAFENRVIPPSNSLLCKYIQYFWILCEPPSLLPFRIKLTPEPCFDIVLCFNSPSVWTDIHSQERLVNRSYLSGIRNAAIELQQIGAVYLVGVRFFPNGLYPFLNIPMHEINNASLDLELIFGARTTELEEKVYEAKTIEDKVAILEQFLLALLCKNHKETLITDQVLSLLHNSSHFVNVKSLTEKTGLGYRRIDREFNKQIGVGPKMYSQLIRFNKLLAQVVHNPTPDWSEISFAHGYFDQAHFIKEFRRFMGVSPTTYLQERNAISELYAQD